MQELGVNSGDHVVVYDRSDNGILTSARVWWMLRVFGHDKGVMMCRRSQV